MIGPDSGAVPPERDPVTNANQPPSQTQEQRVLAVLEALRPMIQRDGGDIEFIEITPAKVVRIRFKGACIGCPSSEMTLKMGIEDNLRAHVPEITGVEAVD